MVGDTVWAKNFAQGPQWLSGTVLRELGPCSFLVLLDDSREVHKHIDHLRPRVPESTSSSQSQAQTPDESCDIDPPASTPDESNLDGGVQPPETSGTEPPRRSDRHRQPPDRLMVSWS